MIYSTFSREKNKETESDRINKRVALKSKLMKAKELPKEMEHKDVNPDYD